MFPPYYTNSDVSEVLKPFQQEALYSIVVEDVTDISIHEGQKKHFFNDFHGNFEEMS